jgi:hypothetical protein
MHGPENAAETRLGSGWVARSDMAASRRPSREASTPLSQITAFATPRKW